MAFKSCTSLCFLIIRVLNLFKNLISSFISSFFSPCPSPSKLPSDLKLSISPSSNKSFSVSSNLLFFPLFPAIRLSFFALKIWTLNGDFIRPGFELGMAAAKGKIRKDWWMSKIGVGIRDLENGLRTGLGLMDGIGWGRWRWDWEKKRRLKWGLDLKRILVLLVVWGDIWE